MTFDKGERHGEAWRDIALRQSEADAVCYLCDDDYWFPNHLAVFRDLFEESDFAHTRNIVISPSLTVRGFTEDLCDQPTREKMLVEQFNFFGLSVAGHRLDAYRRLPVGWSPAPPEMWTDLHMWRKWVEAAGMRPQDQPGEYRPQTSAASHSRAAILSE